MRATESWIPITRASDSHGSTRCSGVDPALLLTDLLRWLCPLKCNSDFPLFRWRHVSPMHARFQCRPAGTRVGSRHNRGAGREGSGVREITQALRTSVVVSNKCGTTTSELDHNQPVSDPCVPRAMPFRRWTVPCGVLGTQGRQVRNPHPPNGGTRAAGRRLPIWVIGRNKTAECVGVCKNGGLRTRAHDRNGGSRRNVTSGRQEPNHNPRTIFTP